MSAIVQQPAEKTQEPISEKTRAVLEAIERIDKKIDILIAEKESWKVALIRAVKQFISQIEPRRTDDQNSHLSPGQANGDKTKK